MQAVPHVYPHCPVPSRLRFFTQDAHTRSTPSLSSILPSVYEDRFYSHRCPLWFSSSTVGCCRHRSAAGSDHAPVGGCPSHSLASPHFVVGVLHDRVDIRRNRPRASLTGVETRRASCRHAVDAQHKNLPRMHWNARVMDSRYRLSGPKKEASTSVFIEVCPMTPRPMNLHQHQR